MKGLLQDDKQDTTEIIKIIYDEYSTQTNILINKDENTRMVFISDIIKIDGELALLPVASVMVLLVRADISIVPML